MKIDVSKEMHFQTARSGGKGGQNVNKVETMVEGYFPIRDSQLLGEAQKQRLLSKLKNRINADGLLMVKSQQHRSQLANKMEVVEKMNLLILEALRQDKPRIATKPSRAAREKRLNAKKILSEKKNNRAGNFLRG